MDRSGEQGAATALRAVLVVNPVFTIIAPFFGIWRFGYVLQCFAKLDVAFTQTGKICARIGSFRGFLAVATSFQEYTGPGPGQAKHGYFT